MADIQSLIIYIGALLLTIIICILYKHTVIHNCFSKLVFLVFMVMPFSVVAGIRDSVGTDYKNYVDIINMLDSFSFYQCFQQKITEVGFALFTKASLLIVHDCKFVFFTTSFLTLFVAFLAFDKIKNEGSMYLSIVIYYLMFYHQSLNIMRQGIAVSFIILALVLISEGKTKRGLLSIIIAVLFHTSAIICIIFLLLYYISKVLKTQRMGWKKTVFYIGIIVSPVIISKLVDVGLNLAIFSHYTYYVSKNSFAGIGIGTLLEALILILPSFALPYLSWRNSEDDVFDLYYLRNVIIMFFPFSIVGYFAAWASRLNLYTLCCFTIFLPLLFARNYSSKNIRIIKVYYVVLIIIRYINSYLIMNYGGTFPYHW